MEGWDRFRARGWLRFETDPRVAQWVAAARPHALDALKEPANAHWYRHGGTWFAGVNLLGNDAEGRIGSAPLEGQGITFIVRHLGAPEAWDKAQISAVFPGYPGKDAT